MTAEKSGLNVDEALVREILVAAAGQAITAGSSPHPEGLVKMTAGPDFDLVMKQAVRAATAHAGRAEKAQSDGMEAWLKSME